MTDMEPKNTPTLVERIGRMAGVRERAPRSQSVPTPSWNGVYRRSPVQPYRRRAPRLPGRPRRWVLLSAGALLALAVILVLIFFA